MSRLFRAAALIGLLAVGGILLFPTIERRIPPNSLPWRELALDQPPGWLAHWHMVLLRGDGDLCRAALTRAGIAFTPLADRKLDGACDYRNVVRLERLPVPLPRRPPTSCALGAAFYWYETLLRAAAKTHMHSELTQIDHVGVFACRNVNNDKDGSRSQHAIANAIDVTGFRFADGRVADVARDYGKSTPQGRFLTAAHEAGCKVFNGVLGPGYNRLHATHYHLDMGPYLICR